MTISFGLPENINNNLNALSNSLGNAQETIDAAFESIDAWVTEAWDSFDARSNSFQDSADGRRMAEFLDLWETYRNDLESARDALADIEYTPAESTDYM